MADEKIYSQLAGDPEFTDLLESFVKDMPIRANRIHDHLLEGKLDDASDILHQLKGAAGIYGFLPIYEAARDLEARVKSQEDGIVEVAKELVNICKKATTEVK
jgi:HPt (histidine-containing phosphotransfer) domain-containing protein